mmetsp:Transcript_9121/g.17871  ORF Transcript_9121/g.17871 Transcript_9121/m.17871 type:complete len:228 (+) Transcript_9121:155-838(+)
MCQWQTTFPFFSPRFSLYSLPLQNVRAPSHATETDGLLPPPSAISPLSPAKISASVSGPAASVCALSPSPSSVSVSCSHSPRTTAPLCWPWGLLGCLSNGWKEGDWRRREKSVRPARTRANFTCLPQRRRMEDATESAPPPRLPFSSGDRNPSFTSVSSPVTTGFSPEFFLPKILGAPPAAPGGLPLISFSNFIPWSSFRQRAWNEVLMGDHSSMNLRALGTLFTFR